MKLLKFFIAVVFLTTTINAQVGINTTSPDSSSSLDIAGIDKGLLIPRVELQSLTDVVTIANPANSLLVFNKVAVNNVQVGFYYWSAPYSRWIKFLDEFDKQGVLFATFLDSKTTVRTLQSTSDKSFNFGKISFNSIIGASISGSSLTLPPGSYMIDSEVNIGRDNFDYLLRINGTPEGIMGTMATVKTQAEIVPKGQRAVFTITTTSTIDFYPNSTNGGATIPVDPTLSYLKVVKF
ncbi:hypothetical protein [Dokdonia sp. R78006]|uniref:hypothetical protein n=1 Tax=unclassified Dokdonia TaxID=2615033 RepID=UPI0036D40DA5